MTDQIEMPEDSLTPQGVGPQLRLAREKLGVTVEQLAARTRISQRHIEHIEAGEFDELPGRTYAMGFARSLAKEVHLDQDDVAAMVRAELDAFEPEQPERRQTYEPGDPARAPSGRLVWFSVLAVLLLVGGLFFAARILFTPAAELPSLVEQQEAEDAAALAANQAAEAETAAAPDAGGEVVFTAMQEGIWVRFYDGAGRRLMEKEMSEGESYTVPTDVENPQLWTGRPDALAITVDGTTVPRLAEELVTMRDVPVDAASLLDRESSGDDTTGDSAT